MNSIEWFIDQLKKEEGIDFIPTSLIEQAKEMHEKEMVEACRKMQIVMDVDFYGDVTFMFSPKDYHNKTYKK